MNHKIILRDADDRVQAFVQELIAKGQLPKNISFADLLSNSIYDSEKDEFGVMFGGVFRTWKVESV